MKPAQRLKSPYGLDNHGIINVRKEHWNHNTPMLYEESSRTAKGTWCTSVPSWCGPACTPAGRPRTSSSWRSRRPRTRYGGATSTNPSPRRCSITCSAACRPTCRTGTSGSRTASPAPTTDTGCRSGWSPIDGLALPVRAQHVHPGDEPEELADHVPEFTVLHAPTFQAIPEVDGTNSEAFILLNLAAQAGADRRHQLRRRDQEIDLHGAELPPARRRTCSPMHCSANVGPDRRRGASSSVSRARARPPCPPIRTAN